MNSPVPNPDLTTTDMLDRLRASGKPLTEWGRATDGTPMLSVRAGGNKQPAIFITAGAHCTETAGVHAALNLLDSLETDHEVHVLPLRDPLGFAGVDHCLSFAAGQTVRVPDQQAALDFLMAHGDLLWHQEDMHIFRLDSVGFVWRVGQPGLENFWYVSRRIRRILRDDPDVLKPLWGMSVLGMNPVSDVEGSDAMQRCYHHVLSSNGAWLHLNRFFGRDDAPPEVMAVDRLLEAVHPGLTCDLHEGNGTGFWMPIPRPKQNPERVFEMTKAYLDYIQAQGYPITTYEEWLATDQTNSDADWMRPEPRLPGFFWCYTELRGEGPNLMDRAGDFGIGYGTEAPMAQPLAMRVDGITNGIQAAIEVWEETAEGLD